METLVRAKDLASAPSVREMFADQTRQINRTKPKAKRSAVVGYRHPDLGDDPQPDPFAALHLEAVREIGWALSRAYPVHGRMVYLEGAGGIVTIELPPLILKPACGIVNLRTTPRPQWGETAVRIFGELLERLRLSREKFDQSAFIRAIERRSQSDVRQGVVPE